MKKILLTALLILGSFISISKSSAVFAAGKADGQSCHDNTECASGYCDYNTYNYRVCLSADQRGENEEPDEIIFSGDIKVTDQLLNTLNPLTIGQSPYKDDFSTPGGIISRLLSFIFPIAGIILFVMLVLGGFQILTSAGDQKGMQAGQQRLTYAIIGFLLLFSSYWIAQVLSQIFNIKIL